MLRNDVFYATPIDVYETSIRHEHDFDNSKIILPGWGKFGNFPVNDRMVAGPYEAIRLWATSRFGMIDEHVTKDDIGRAGMHSETFMKRTILPAMVNVAANSTATTALRYELEEHPAFCFLRARSDGTLWKEDCTESPLLHNCDLTAEIQRILAGYHNRSGSIVCEELINNWRKPLKCSISRQSR